MFTVYLYHFCVTLNHGAINVEGTKFQSDITFKYALFMLQVTKYI